MYDKFDKMMEKKGKKVSSPMHQKAKMDVLSDLKDQASSDMGEKLAGLKKVSVTSPSQEGLEAGLDAANEMVHDMPDMGKDNSELGDTEEPQGDLNLMGDNLSEEDIDQRIVLLMKLKEKLKNKEHVS